MYQFFEPNETELKQIIYETIGKNDSVIGAQIIPTGWTNITIDVHGELHDYIFRFPRNLFFAEMMVKDCTICQCLQGKTTIRIPDMHLMSHQNRPFSMHYKIPGRALTQVMDAATDVDREQIVADMALFLSELHHLPIETLPTAVTESLNDFLSGLATVHQGQYDLDYHHNLVVLEQQMKKPCILHGDFNPGNILGGDDYRVSAIIDFSFVSVSDPHADIGRFVGRSDSEWGEALIEAYQAQNHKLCDREKIRQIVDLFKYVEYKYVEYMQHSHPEIVIPPAVLKMAAAEKQKYTI